MASYNGKRKKGKSNNKKRKYKSVKKYRPYQTKFVRITRWSNNETSNNVHLTIQGSAAGNNIGSTNFRLSHVAGSGEIRALFDNYCIRKITYRWCLGRNPDYTTTAGKPGVFPRLTWVHDFNDANPIDRATMLQHPRMREFWFNESNQKTRWYTLKPASLVTMYETGLTTAYKPAWGQFVDTNDLDMTHYGIKYAYNELYEGNGMNIYLEAKITIDCKGIS